MAATQLGTDVQTGVGSTVAGYIVVSLTSGGKEVMLEDIVDENGVLYTRIVNQTMPKLSAELIPLSASSPATDFVTGAICALGVFDGYYMDDVSIEKTANATKVSVSGTLIGIE